MSTDHRVGLDGNLERIQCNPEPALLSKVWTPNHKSDFKLRAMGATHVLGPYSAGKSKKACGIVGYNNRVCARWLGDENR